MTGRNLFLGLVGKDDKTQEQVYLDFAKVFDEVDISITLHKLKFMDIRGQLGRWLTAFLTNHQQTVLFD